MDFDPEQIRYWADYAKAMGNEDYRERFTKLFIEIQEAENKLVDESGLQKPLVNPLQYTEDKT
jgi:hypothetical protein